MTKQRIVITAEANVAGHETAIPCNACGDGVFIVRENRATGHTFLGCSEYPECAATAEIVTVSEKQRTLL